MNIEFSKEQFRVMLDLIFAGNWIINANRENELAEKHDELEGYIFSKCGEFGLKEFAEQIDGRYCPSAYFDESGIMDLVDEYNEGAVFHELAERLSYRDAPKGLKQEEFNDFLDERFDRYMEEFELNGFEHVNVKL